MTHTCHAFIHRHVVIHFRWILIFYSVLPRQIVLMLSTDIQRYRQNLTSKEANIKDPEVKELSKQIIECQEAEIEQMKNDLKRIE